MITETKAPVVFIEDNLTKLSNNDYKTYEAFIYCYGGKCQFTYNDVKHEMNANTCTIIQNPKCLTKLKTSEDFVCKVLFIEESFLRQSSPHNPYIIHGTLSIAAHPVMELNEDEQNLCKELFKNFKLRLEDTGHRFYEDILRTSACMLMLDFYDFHAKVNKSEEISASSANIMSKFIDMLENKEYRENREVAYYAKQLCVVPKYLSEISNKTSGFSASYWINRYTSQDISEMLRSGKYTASQVSEIFNFTSTSYFNRYVKRTLGVYPTELRKK